MTAFLILCLLAAASVHGDVTGRFSWFSSPDDTEDPQMEHVCLTDQASCGCCLMQQQMKRMEEFFNMSLNELQSSLQMTTNIINSVRASRSAFSVALTDVRVCLGPYRDIRPVIYKHVFINLGDGYNTTTGIFTVPRSGVYSLSLTVYSDSGSPGASLDACATLIVNGATMFGPHDRNDQDQEDSSTNVVAMQLQAGDQVAVNLPIGCFLCDNNSHFNTFSGFLLYATD